MLVLAIGCKQVNDGGQNPSDPIKSNEVTITVKGDDGVTVNKSNTIKIKKNLNLTWKDIRKLAEAKLILKENFEIKEWHLNNADGTIIKDETEFKENATVFAVSKGKIVGYKVEHLKENIEDENYTKAEEEPKTGEAGKNTSAEAKQYEGFSCQGLAQTVIKIDGSTVVQIKYKRNRVSLILDLDGGKTTTQLKDGKDGKKLLEGKFEARVEVKGLEKENYSFEKWEPELPQTFPATSQSTIYIAKWETQTVVYRVAVAGDERVKVSEPNYINVPSESNKKIEDIKAEILAKVSLKAEWSDVDYTFYDWRIGGEEGEEMLDSTPINGDMVVYARTNYKRFKLDGTILVDYEGERPRGRIFIPKEITLIRGDTFRYCIDLTAVDLSSCTKLEEIRYGAFSSCRKLRSVNLNGCSKLVTIAGSGSLREYGSFSDCTSLESIDLSQCTNLAKIESCAFYGCRKLKIVNLTDCTKLTKLNLYGTAIKNIDLSLCTELMDIGFARCEYLESIDLSPCTKLVVISDDTFSGCSEAGVELPASITEIRNNAFGEDLDTYCKKVLVPNAGIKQLVVNSGYPEERIELY